MARSKSSSSSSAAAVAASSSSSSSQWAWPLWLWVWILLQFIIIPIDAGFVLLRPRSQPGGDLAWFFKPYELYQSIDHVYRDMEGAWNPSQAVCNLLEISMLAIAIFAYLSGSRGGRINATLWATLATAFTFWKTVLYGLMEVNEGFANIKHNSMQNLVLLYIIPNGIWIVVPLIILVGNFAKFSNALTVAHQKQN